MGALDRSRPLVGAQALGIARGALELATSYVQERKQFGSRLADFQGLQFMLADMATAGRRGGAARLPRVLAARRAGCPAPASASSMAKLFASDTAMRVTTDCVQLLGGIGYTKDLPAERFMRDAKITQIYEGTNQIQRVVIAKAPAVVTVSSTDIRLRFSPAPTGFLHIGSVRTALFNWLQARHTRRHVHPPHRGHRRRPLDRRSRSSRSSR